MPLPEGFQFSQSNLQAYVDCKRYFYLRYLLKTAWPAVKTEPALENEKFERMGLAFHRLAQQHLLGIDEARLSAAAEANQIGGEQLANWWKIFLAYVQNLLGPLPKDAAVQRLPEVILTAPARLGKAGSFPYRLFAKYDALAIISSPSGERRAAILDWKTGRRKTKRSKLEKKLQTRVYLLLCVLAGTQFNKGKPFQPDLVEMIYWFTAQPEQPERFNYNQQRFDEDCDFLAGLIREIEACSGKDLPPVGDGDNCAWCVYRSFCDQGTRAGGTEDIDTDEEDDFDFDFEKIDEISG